MYSAALHNLWGLLVKSLYIIGNGFDLHFGLETTTDDFIECMRNI